MKNSSYYALVIAIFFSYELSFAHGEEKPGPHGGHIRMPGAFHTELVVDKFSQFKIYLLDMEWKNPLVKNSSVQMKINDDKNLIQCEKFNNYFQCQPTQIFDLNKPNIISIIANRDGAIGSSAIYEFPLQVFHLPKNTESIKKEIHPKSNSHQHSGHH